MGLVAYCERLSEGLLAQPVNAVSSLAYVAAGAALAVPAFRTASPRRAERLTFAVVAAADGLGSVLFHGGRFAGGQAVHDGALLATLLFLGTHDLAITRCWAQRRALTVYAAGTAAIVTLLLAWPGMTNVWAAVLACGCLGAEVAVMRAGAPAVPSALALLACGAVLDLAGRTGGPLCQPDSLLQGHAAWHVLTAAALWEWGRHRLGARPPAVRANPAPPGRVSYAGGRDRKPGDVDLGLKDGALPEGISCVAGGGNAQVVTSASAETHAGNEGRRDVEDPVEGLSWR